MFTIYIQIYIVRANEFTTADGAVSLLNLEVCKKGKLLSKSSRVNIFYSGILDMSCIKMS
jgi:hypothetical protein